MKGASKHNQEIVEEILVLYRQGMSLTEIKEDTGLKMSVRNIGRMIRNATGQNLTTAAGTDNRKKK